MFSPYFRAEFKYRLPGYSVGAALPFNMETWEKSDHPPMPIATPRSPGMRMSMMLGKGGKGSLLGRCGVASDGGCGSARGGDCGGGA